MSQKADPATEEAIETTEETEELSELQVLSQELQKLKDLVESKSIVEESLEEESESMKPTPDPIHIKYAESLKKQLGNYFDIEWDKQPLLDRIHTMEIASSVASKRQAYRGKATPPTAEANGIKESLIGDFHNYKKLAAKIKKS